nr:MAG TPA: minor capsid protein [Caudoviricetes sp.]
MAEKLTAKKRKEDLNKLFAEYNRRLGILYSGYVKKLLALGYSEDVLENDALFNFDNFPVLKARLNEIFNDYFQNSMLCYKSGITSGVSLAYSHDNDALGQFSVLTDKALETARKTAAATFIANRLNAKKGLNLAQSVWNYCQQTKAEFEMAMSNVIADGLEKGTSAEEVGRRIRQYLNNPDMMYRRYHTVKVLKNGQKKDVVTWRRKRIINGRVRFVEEPLEHVGQGVYRSARKNALRVARTEINAAYHKARNGRWANEPFVIGQHIHISPQHDPDEDADICDELEGYYPKDFDWDSWHSQCMCTSDPVMISGEERKQFYKRTLNGEDMSGYVSPNSIKDVPDQYKRYIEANGDKIVDAFKRGKLAWHLANNKSYWVKNLDAAQRKQMGVKAISRREAIQAIAKARHAKRDAAKIQQKLEEATDDDIHRANE